MMFGFPNVEYKKFSKNFLRTVVFQINFKKLENFNEFREVLSDSFKHSFPRINKNLPKGFQISLNSNNQTPILQSLKEDDGIELKSENGQKVIRVTNGSFVFTINGNEYKGFELILKELSSFTAILSDFKINEVNRLSIRKLNIVEFKVTDNPFSMLSLLLSPYLSNNFEYYPSQQFIEQNIQTLRYKKDEFRLNLNYGLNLPILQNPQIGQVLIDIDLINTSKIDVLELEKIATEMNQEIFNVFNWAVSDKTLALLGDE